MGYRIERSSFELPDLDLTDDEVRALQVALAATRPDSAIGEEALPSLAGLVGELVVRFDAPSGVAGVTDFAVGGCTAASCVVSLFGQCAKSGAVGAVVAGRVLVRRWIRSRRGAPRTFRVDRCEGEVAIDSAIVFEPPSDADVGAALPTNPLLLGDEVAAEREAVVHIAARRAWLVEREIGSERILVRHDDGSITIRLPFTNEDALRSWVLGFLDDAELLEPVDAGSPHRVVEGGGLMAQRPATERLRRLLIILPWLMERGEVSVDEVAERFSVGVDDLIRDLELVSMCGLPSRR